MIGTVCKQNISFPSKIKLENIIKAFMHLQATHPNFINSDQVYKSIYEIMSKWK